jgi:hypothetical protein
MNEQLQLALASIIGTANEGVAAGVNFLSAEIPEVVYQLLLWHGVKAFVGFVLALLLIPAYLWAERKAYLSAYGVEGWDGEDVAFCWGLMGMLVRIPVIMVIFSYLNLEWLQIWLAPKVWLIEYVAQLAK